MEKIELKNEPYFTYSTVTKYLEWWGELTGTYMLCKNIKCENFQAVICLDTQQVFLIGNKNK